MMKFRIAAALVALVASGPAFSADMPVKAEPSPFLIYNGSGFYWAVGTSARVADASANGNLLIGNLLSSNVKAAGGGIDFEVGYIWGKASAIGFLNWYRVYASATYQNISGSQVATSAATGPQSLSVVSRWQAQQGFDVNADLFNYIFSTFGWSNPFPAFTPQPPSNLTLATIPHQYVGGFITEVGLGGNFGPSTTGAQIGIAPGVRTGFIWQTLGKDGKPNGAAFDTGVQVAWMTKGVTLNNVFAPNGAPVALQNGVDMGTTYSVYAHLAF
jgi:hypothetical protein